HTHLLCLAHPRRVLGQRQPSRAAPQVFVAFLPPQFAVSIHLHSSTPSSARKRASNHATKSSSLIVTRTICGSRLLTPHSPHMHTLQLLCLLRRNSNTGSCASFACRTVCSHHLSSATTSQFFTSSASHASPTTSNPPPSLCSVLRCSRGTSIPASAYTLSTTGCSSAIAIRSPRLPLFLLVVPPMLFLLAKTSSYVGL